MFCLGSVSEHFRHMTRPRKLNYLHGLKHIVIKRYAFQEKKLSCDGARQLLQPTPLVVASMFSRELAHKGRTTTQSPSKNIKTTFRECFVKHKSLIYQLNQTLQRAPSLDIAIIFQRLPTKRFAYFYMHLQKITV